MRSKIDPFTINEDESRAIIEAYCRKNFWKYRKMDWDNDIDGEIEVFDIDRETTAKFVKVQLKTIDDPSKFTNSSEFYAFDAETKFLHFCDVCDVPVILIVFNIRERTGYFLFVQKHIYEVLNLERPKWRENTSSVRIKLPLADSLHCDSSKSKLEDIAFRGASLITQLRKIATHKKYYSVLKQDDNSHGTALRTSIKVLVEKSFATSKEAMRILIPKINNEYLRKIYHRNRTLAQTHNKNEYDVIYMFFYDSLNQSKQGQTFCRTLWIADELPTIAMPSISPPDDHIEGINIYWDNHEAFDDFIDENLLGKGEYIPIIDGVIGKLTNLYVAIAGYVLDFKEGKSNSEELTHNLKMLSPQLDALNDSISDIGLPPNECHEMDVKLRSLVSFLHNIKIVLFDESRNMSNVIACINMYMREIDQGLPELKYERKKVN